MEQYYTYNVRYTSNILKEIEKLLNQPLTTKYTGFWFKYGGDNIIIVDKEEVEIENDRKHFDDYYFNWTEASKL